jgi:hypothetical protein
MDLVSCRWDLTGTGSAYPTISTTHTAQPATHLPLLPAAPPPISAAGQASPELMQCQLARLARLPPRSCLAKRGASSADDPPVRNSMANHGATTTAGAKSWHGVCVRRVPSARNGRTSDLYPKVLDAMSCSMRLYANNMSDQGSTAAQKSHVRHLVSHAHLGLDMRYADPFRAGRQKTSPGVQGARCVHSRVRAMASASRHVLPPSVDWKDSPQLLSISPPCVPLIRVTSMATVSIDPRTNASIKVRYTCIGMAKGLVPRGGFPEELLQPLAPSRGPLQHAGPSNTESADKWYALPWCVGVNVHHRS